MIAAAAFGLEIAEWVVIVGGMFAVAELLGLSRSGRTIRRENADLRERNATLEGDVKRLSDELVRLSALVDDLKRRDQAAVLEAIHTNEVIAQHRHEEALGVWKEIRDAVKGARP